MTKRGSRKSFNHNAIINRRFGKLVVRSWSHDAYITTNRGRQLKHYYLCDCDCGKTYLADYNALVCNHVRSCGCLQLEVASSHKMTKHRLWRIWCGMHTRCYNKRDKGYSDYGGRGIYICDEWRSTRQRHSKSHTVNIPFNTFVKWAYANGFYDQEPGLSRSELLSIDRIDNDGPYAPWNCRWVIGKDQHRNTRYVKFIEDLDGLTYYSEFERRYKLPREQIASRMRRNWSHAAIVYEAHHRDLGLRRLNGQYVDKDGFIRMIPSIDIQRIIF